MGLRLERVFPVLELRPDRGSFQIIQRSIPLQAFYYLCCICNIYFF